MIMMLDLLDDVMILADQKVTTSGMRTWGEEIHDCDGCGEVPPDVDLWAEDTATGEQLWLCEACGGLDLHPAPGGELSFNSPQPDRELRSFDRRAMGRRTLLDVAAKVDFRLHRRGCCNLNNEFIQAYFSAMGPITHPSPTASATVACFGVSPDGTLGSRSSTTFSRRPIGWQPVGEPPGCHGRCRAPFSRCTLSTTSEPRWPTKTKGV